MYTAAQQYRAEAATTKKKSEKRADGSRVKVQENEQASERKDGRERKRKIQRGEEGEKERENARKISLPFNCRRCSRF